MDFTTKLKRLTDGRNKSNLSRRAGLPATTISNYIAKGSIPRADIALKIARAVGVSLDWLVDEDRNEWPPPKSSLESIELLELMEEVRRRYLHEAIPFWQLQQKIRSYPWDEVASELSQKSFDAELSPKEREADKLLLSLYEGAHRIAEFDPSPASWDAIIDRDNDHTHLRFDELLRFPDQMGRENTSFSNVNVFFVMRRLWSLERGGEGSSLIEHRREVLRKMIEAEQAKKGG